MWPSSRSPRTAAAIPAAHPAPHTVGQALRAYVNRLHSPLSQRGPAMNVGEGTGDTGLSRYPPAEGERDSQGGPTTNVGEGAIRHRCEQLSSRRRASETLPAEEPRPPSGAEPTEENGAASPPGPTAGGWHASGSERPQGQRRSRQAESACAGDDSFPGERCLSVSLLQFDWPAADRASCHVDDRHAVPGGCAPGIRKRRRSRYLRFRYAWKRRPRQDERRRRNR